MIEGGFTSVSGGGGVGVPMDGESGLETSSEMRVGAATGDGGAGFGCDGVGRDGVGSVMGVDGVDCGVAAADGVEAIGAAPPWFSKTSCRFPPMERLMACSSTVSYTHLRAHET